MVKNPIMFIVEIGFFISFIQVFLPQRPGGTGTWFSLSVALILLFTVLFANFAEALAEGRGKAQAGALKKSKQDMIANVRMKDGSIRHMPSDKLKVDDIVIVSQGEWIPGDGEVIKGIASVDESAITGESAPVMKEAGGDFNSVSTC